jgi:hypothetical protein
MMLSALFNIGYGEKERTIDNRSNLVGTSRLTASQEIRERRRGSPQRALRFEKWVAAQTRGAVRG